MPHKNRPLATNRFNYERTSHRSENNRARNSLLESVRKVFHMILAVTCAVIVAHPQTGTISSTVSYLSVDHSGSSSYCGGDNILFYNTHTGQGETGKLTASGFQRVRSYRPGEFAKNWTHVSQVDRVSSVLFYNANTGDGAIGDLDRGTFKTTNTYSNLSRGWTSILYAGLNSLSVALPIFYNASDGTLAIGFAPSQRVLKGTVSAGWSHVVWNDSGILFYNSGTGSGAVAVPSGNASGVYNNLTTTKSFGSGAFLKNWTHVVATGSNILFYNHRDGSAALGRLLPSSVGGASDFTTQTSFAAGRFAPHWTHIVSAGNLLLFYNSASGDGAIGRVANDQFSTIATMPLPRGYTHIVCSEDVGVTGP